MKPIYTLAVTLLISWASLFGQTPQTRIITIYDNHKINTHTRSDWGFACLIIHGSDTVLFDTGARSDVFFHNLKALGIDPKTIHTIVVSHHHGDHIGNVFEMVRMQPGINVYLPSSLHGAYTLKVVELGGKVSLKSDCEQIAKDIYLSGEMGFQIKEQALVIDTEKGLVIISGCGHPGIDRMIAKIKETFNKDIFLVMGGFHTLESNEEQSYEMIEKFREFGVKKVSPSHCTGKLTSELFMEAYQSSFIKNGTGKIIEF